MMDLGQGWSAQSITRKQLSEIKVEELVTLAMILGDSSTDFLEDIYGGNDGSMVRAKPLSELLSSVSCKENKNMVDSFINFLLRRRVQVRH